MTRPPGDPPPSPDGPAEVARLKEIIRALMDRAERSTLAAGSEFGLFQSTIMLQEQVRRRTAELEEALRDNETMNRSLRESEARFYGLVSQSLVGITLVEDGSFTYSNDKFNEIFGYSSDEVRGMKPCRTAVEADRPMIDGYIEQRLSGELDRVSYGFHGLRKDGAVIDVECNGSVMRISNKLILISMIMDVTERVRTDHEVLALQDQLLEQSRRDALTGLYNRRYLNEFLERELTLARRSGNPISVIMGDLDHFKAINDCYGHLAGDEVLRVFGGLLTRHTRVSDISCRYGGEEFLLVLPHMTGANAVKRAEQVRQAIESTVVRYGPERISVTASFGVASFPSHGRTSDELVAAADNALYEAKATGRNRVSNVSSRSEPQPSPIPGSREPARASDFAHR